MKRVKYTDNDRSSTALSIRSKEKYLNGSKQKSHHIISLIVRFNIIYVTVEEAKYKSGVDQGKKSADYSNKIILFISLRNGKQSDERQ